MDNENKSIYLSFEIKRIIRNKKNQKLILFLKKPLVLWTSMFIDLADCRPRQSSRISSTY